MIKEFYDMTRILFPSQEEAENNFIRTIEELKSSKMVWQFGSTISQIIASQLKKVGGEMVGEPAFFDARIVDNGVELSVKVEVEI